MISRTIEVEHVDSSKQVDKRPITIKWKGVPMIRNHSLMAACREILHFDSDVKKIGIVGEPDTGKTTLADVIGHIIHKESEREKGVKYAIRSFGKEEFMNMERTLKTLEPANYILKFRDLSFLTANATKKQIDIVKQIITEIRHLRVDVKIILIYDYHYTLGLDKYLRQSNFKFFTSVGSSEEDNLTKIVGTKYLQRIRHFKNISIQLRADKKASFQLRRNAPPFVYAAKNPFLLALFWNEQRLRYVVFPKREWIDPICADCSIGQEVVSEIDVEQFKKEFNADFGNYTAEAAVKLKAFSTGMNTYSSAVVNALKYLDKALMKKRISLEALLVSYDLSLSRTRLRKQLHGVLTADDSKEMEDLAKL